MPKWHPECWIASVVRIEANKALLDIESIWLAETEDGKGLWRKLTPPIRAWVPVAGLEVCEA